MVSLKVTDPLDDTKACEMMLHDVFEMSRAAKQIIGRGTLVGHSNGTVQFSHG